MTLPVLHAVTDDELLARPDFVRAAYAVMRAGGPRVALHLRTTSRLTRPLWALATSLAPAQQETGAWLVVNGRVDVALAVGAHGVQLGRRAPAVSDVAALRTHVVARGVAHAGTLGIGASVHAVHDAVVAASAGADWLLAGHVFVSASHPAEAARGVAFVRDIVLATTRPVIAIGGVTPATVGTLRLAGASGVAAIRGLWGQPDATTAVGEYLSAYDDADRDLDPTHGQR